jgi:hypothetical protein
MIFDKDTIKEKLRTGNCTVVFTKADGTERSMLCTLQETFIPAEQKPKGEVRKQNDDALAVWDIEKQAWRSFRYDAIKQFV